MNYIETRELKARFRKGEPALPIQKASVAINEPLADRQIKFTISTAAVDRDHDIIKQDGWQLANYKKNPVVLLNHKADELPIARCVNLGIEDGDLKATVEFIPPHYPVIGDVADAVYQLCINGFLNATSVGFRPLKWDWSDDDEGDGIVFSTQELLEFSIVSVPSNPEALIQPPSIFAGEEPKSMDAINITKNRLRLRLRTLQLLDF